MYDTGVPYKCMTQRSAHERVTMNFAPTTLSVSPIGPFSNGRVADLIIFTLRFIAAGGTTIGMYFAGQNGGF